MKKQKLSASEVELIKKDMQRVIAMSAGEQTMHMARTIGEVYDEELPIPEVITSIFRTDRAEVGEHVYYLAPASITKSVYALTSDCIVTQTKVTPNTRTEVSWTDIISPEFYVCIHDWLKGDHDVLDFYGRSINEAMNRQEIYAVLQLVDAGAVAQSNTYTLDSGKTKFDYPKLVEMARSLAKYGSKMVLITGANVTTDIVLMDYDADKNRETKVADVVDQWIKVEELSVSIGGTPTTVMSADVAYLVAVSDSEANMPGIFVRRKTGALAQMGDTTAVAKERVIIDGGNFINVASDRKFSKSVCGYEEYSATLVNANTVAKFTRS
jgi:hypothetical protein